MTTGRDNSASVDLDSCTIGIFPFFYGHTSAVKTNYMALDSNQNIMLAGQSDKKPFGDVGTDSSLNGFVGIVNQLGQPMWIYIVNYDLDDTKSETCLFLSEYNANVYALCQASNSLYQDKPLMPLVLKLS